MTKADGGSRLLATLDRWSRIGVPDFGDDFHKARAASALNIVLAGLAVITIVGAGGIAAFTAERHVAEALTAASLTASFATVIFVTHWLMRLGRVRTASVILLVGLWVIFSMRIALSGGYRSPAGLSYALLCTIAGLLLGWRAAFAALVTCGFTLLALLGAESLGYQLPNTLMNDRGPIFVSYATSLGVFVIMLAFAWTRETMDEAVLKELQARQIVEQVRESEDRFRLLAESGFEAIAITKAGVLVDKNSRLAQMLGYKPGEMIGMRVFDMVAPEHRDRVMRHIQSGSEDAYEHMALHKNGRRVPVEVRGKSMMYRGANVRITAIRDLSDRYRNEEARVALEERLRQSQKMEAVGQLAGGVAHDFNNLLMMVGTQAELLQMDDTISPESREGVGEILTAVKRAASLTQQLLTLSRRKVIQTTDMDLNDSVAQTAKMLRRVLPEDIAIDARYAEQSLPIRADQSMIEQVLINLAVNARDALGPGGTISISTSRVEIDSAVVRTMHNAREGEFACLTVSDTGSGISAEVLPRIFEPFFTTKDVGKGTGLGLATADGIVAQHNGWISVQSTPGKGTSFRVFIPIATPAAESVAAVEDPAKLAPQSETILLTEDEDGVRDVLRVGLQRMGHRVLTANTGAAAIRQWENERGGIDVLVTDIVMPDGMSGWDLAKELRSRKPELRVICMSGYSAGVAKPEGEDADDLTYLQKPFSLDNLADAMRTSRRRTTPTKTKRV
jgi:two-component system cell cycle sensor histidine kinase/response regulator CckA